METYKTYLDFLNYKYGNEVVKALTTLESDNLIRLKGGDSSEIYVNNKFQQNIISKIDELLGDKILDFNANTFGDWAFDFPGWIGDLRFNEYSSNKEIMVIGMEPHIENRDFQVCYGLRDLNDEGDLLGGNNKNLYKNIIDVFGDYESLAELSTIRNYDDVLNKVYITDLCHFAIKGKAKEIFKVKNWKRIRNQIALDLLEKEIKFIKPKFILSQGTEVSNFIEKNFFRGTDYELISQLEPKDFNMNLGERRFKNFPKFTKYAFNGLTIAHIKLPHAASGLTQGFWLNSKKEQRKERLNIIKDFIKSF